MTELEELEALDDLISAVKAGETCRVHIERMSAQAGLAEAGSIYGNAYQGSVDSGLLVYEALQLGGEGHVIEFTTEDDKVTCRLHNAYWSNPYRVYAVSPTKGKALFLACLYAYRSTLVAS